MPFPLALYHASGVHMRGDSFLQDFLVAYVDSVTIIYYQIGLILQNWWDNLRFKNGGSEWFGLFTYANFRMNSLMDLQNALIATVIDGSRYYQLRSLF